MPKRLYRFEYVQEGQPGTVIASPIGGTFAEQVIIPAGQGLLVGAAAGAAAGFAWWLVSGLQGLGGIATHTLTVCGLVGTSIFATVVAQKTDKASEDLDGEDEPEAPELPTEPEDMLRINGWRDHAPRMKSQDLHSPVLRADPVFFLFIHRAGQCEDGPSREKLTKGEGKFSQGDYIRYTHRLVEVGLWKYRNPENENLGFTPLVDAVKAAQMVRDNRWHLWPVA